MRRTPAILAALALLTGCTNYPAERAVTGAVIGAGVGALAGATILEAGPGAILGAGVGAVIGATTNTDEIDLSPPFIHQDPYK